MDASAKSEKGYSVPLFLLKLMDLLESPQYHQFVKWSIDGKSFLVLDQERFSKTVLPKYFKHNKFTSFVRQLNLYGFRKVNPINSGMNEDKEQVEFRHPFFVKDKPNLLHMIKRKVSLPSNKHSEEIATVLEEVTEIRDNQSEITSTLSSIKQENEDLWREVVSLRQKHSQQQKVVNHLIKFLVTLVQQHGMGGPGRKRGLPIAWKDDNSDTSQIKLAKPSFQAASVSGPEVPDVLNTIQSPADGPLITELLSTGSSSSITPESNQSEAEAYNVLASNKNNSDVFDISDIIGSDNSTNVQNALLLSNQDQAALASISPAIEPNIFLNLPSSMASNVVSSTSNVSSFTAASPVNAGTGGLSPTKVLQRSNSVRDLSTSVDKVQQNLQTIQEHFTDHNEQYQLDYDAIQDLFNGRAVLPSQISEWSTGLPMTIPLADTTGENQQLVEYTGDNPSLHFQSNVESDKETEFDDLAALLE